MRKKIQTKTTAKKKLPQQSVVSKKESTDAKLTVKKAKPVKPSKKVDGK